MVYCSACGGQLLLVDDIRRHRHKLAANCRLSPASSPSSISSSATSSSLSPPSPSSSSSSPYPSPSASPSPSPSASSSSLSLHYHHHLLYPRALALGTVCIQLQADFGLVFSRVAAAGVICDGDAGHSSSSSSSVDRGPPPSSSPPLPPLVHELARPMDASTKATQAHPFADPLIIIIFAVRLVIGVVEPKP